MDNYYQEVITRIKSLINESKWQQALVLVQEELAMIYIPQQYQAEFQKLHSDIVFSLNQQKNQNFTVWTLEKISNVLADSAVEEQHMIALYYLQNYNARLILEQLVKYLVNPDMSNSSKTRVLVLLKMQGINEEFLVVKSHGTFKVKIQDFPIWNQLLIYQQVRKLLEQKIYHDNPGLFEICDFLLNNYFESLMPKIPNLKHTNAIAAAIYIRACSLQFIRVTLLSSTKLFHSTSALIKKYLLDLKQHIIT